MDYKQFRAQNGLSTKDMIAAVRETCPKYSKIQQSMVDGPDKYGVCLLPALDEMLIERFGSSQKSVVKKQPQRKKANRFQVWLDDDTAKKFMAIRAREGSTTQQLLQDLIENLISLAEINNT